MANKTMSQNCKGTISKILLCSVLFFPIGIYSQSQNYSPEKMTRFNINRITTRILNNGIADNKSEPLGNIIFKRYLLINKSDKKIEDMYTGVWADAESRKSKILQFVIIK